MFMIFLKIPSRLKKKPLEEKNLIDRLLLWFLGEKRKNSAKKDARK